ncbi:Long-chain acyl-CoA synthetase (AMP-forming) [Pseudomonas sp. ok272]|uniref:AMP-dependent synthetase/ligase n=1 Tax=unclassified Pseudomonas TaxID=196821 RepID=UPI0008B23340|nr:MULTISPECIES: AMP-dependent synthetase/ligase [unclassified Pseudomonas]SEN00485.1 Long-chain acyl-CoA synthetase (AMP-forming) [Pseudomonas sp. ok272]SFM88621.1 Long-chain acyl-CoA synthetase (AMP-forming) [Pseudomonas sp. ok602]
MKVASMSPCDVGHRNFLHELDHFVARAPDAVFLRALDPVTTLSRSEFADQVGRLAAVLREIGVRKDESVGLLMGNTLEFYVADAAVLAAGGVPVSLYPTSSPEQLDYMTRDAGINLLITEAGLLGRLTEAEKYLDMLDTVAVIDDLPAQVATARWPIIELRQLMKTTRQRIPLAEAAKSVHAEDLLTLVYTSGTTGAPKGVRLSHANLLSAAQSMGTIMQLGEGGRIISWLPHAHVAGRVGQYYCAVLFGVEVTICPDQKLLPVYLTIVKPTYFFAVPRLWEKLKAGIEADFARLPEHAQAELHRALSAHGEAQPSSSPSPASGQADADYFAPLRAKLGLDQARVLNTGTAPTPRHVLAFFAALGLPIGNIYGATETCACGAMGQPGQSKPGSVGRAVPGMQIAIAKDGEVLLRGLPVMQGYHHQPEKTAEALSEDGWYRTGDVGRLDDDGYLWITDRKKELIINSSGKNMSPANIEAMIKSGDPLIGSVCVVGDARPYNIALIVLDPDYAKAWAAARQITGPITTLASHPEVLAAVAAGVERGNQRLSRVEQVKRFTLLAAEWPAAGDELTATLKLKRKAIEHKYAQNIEQMYID